jgi:hypothetical protein
MDIRLFSRQVFKVETYRKYQFWYILEDVEMETFGKLYDFLVFYLLYIFCSHLVYCVVL